ncbi:hypothetical protein BDR06DRAFT_967436 [Suillus hirtellus]|nr:hypothetical protein BDR06DRAFT_967436 [Suillus hirtellus]
MSQLLEYEEELTRRIFYTQALDNNWWKVVKRNLGVSKKSNSEMWQSSAIDDDLSDILRGYIQKHEMSSGTDSQEDDHDSSMDDYQPGSSEKCSPSWTRSDLAEDLVTPELQDEIKAPAFQQLQTLNLQMSIGGAVLNFFLMTKWYLTHGKGPLQYADMHYCVVIFDYCKQQAHILRQHTITSDTAPGISLQSNSEECHLSDDWDPTDYISQKIIDKRLEEFIQTQNNQAIIIKLTTILSQDPNETQNDNSLDSDPEDINSITNLVYRFDQYWGGPTLESIRPIMDAGQIWSFLCNAWISALGSAMLFRNYGFRLFLSFYQMFWLGPPVDHLDHIMTVGVSNTYDPSQQMREWSFQVMFISWEHLRCY